MIKDALKFGKVPQIHKNYQFVKIPRLKYT